MMKRGAKKLCCLITLLQTASVIIGTRIVLNAGSKQWKFYDLETLDVRYVIEAVERLR